MTTSGAKEIGSSRSATCPKTGNDEAVSTAARKTSRISYPFSSILVYLASGGARYWCGASAKALSLLSSLIWRFLGSFMAECAKLADINIKVFDVELSENENLVNGKGRSEQQRNPYNRCRGYLASIGCQSYTGFWQNRTKSSVDCPDHRMRRMSALGGKLPDGGAAWQMQQANRAVGQLTCDVLEIAYAPRCQLRRSTLRAIDRRAMPSIASP